MNFKRSGKTILIAAKDAGGCNALMPVINKIRDNYSLFVIADRPASDIFTKNGIRVDISKCRFSDKEFKNAFQDNPPALALVGTSWGESIEDSVVKQASRYGIPSVGLLDAWFRYDERFSKASERWHNLPDYLIVMDKDARNEIIKMGVPGERVFSIGNPFFEEVSKKAAAAKKRLRHRMPNTKKRVLFLSEPNSLYNVYTDSIGTKGLGYDEFKTVKSLINILKNIERKRKAGIELLVKLHPAEKGSDKFKELIGYGHMKIINSGLYELMYEADLVVGMQSTALVEASMLGIANLSYQPGLQVKDTLITNRLKIGEFCYSEKTCKVKIEKLLFDKRYRNISAKKTAEKIKGVLITRGVTAKVIEFIEKVVGSNRRPAWAEFTK